MPPPVSVSAKVRRALRSALRQTSKALASSLRARRRWRIVGDQHDRTQYAHLLPTENWSRVKKFGASRVRTLVAKTSALSAEQKKLARALADNQELLKHAEVLPPKLSAGPGWADRRRTILKDLVKRGMSAAAANEALQRVENVSPKQRLQDRQQQLRRRCADLDKDAEDVLAAHMAGVFAQAVADFNSRTKARGRASVAEPRVDVLDRRLRRLQGLVGARRWAAIASECRRLETAALTQLDRSASACAESARRGGGSARDSRKAIEAADAARFCLEVIAICRALGWASGWSSDEVLSAPWVGGSRLAYAKPFAVPAKSVRVNGIVRSVKITHVGRKPVTRIEVEAGNTLRIVGLSHIKGDSGGIVPGASVDLQCVLKRSVDWLGDRNVHVMQRYSYEKSAKTSWRGWLRHRIDRVFSPTSNGLAGRWSWQPGKYGAGNPLVYGVWSGPRDARRRPYGL